MTIDEAIIQEKEMAMTFETKDFAEYHDQIAEWLEELKTNRIALEKANGYLEVNHRLGYNKAIDDFVKYTSDMPTVEGEDGEIRPMWLEEIAEQLKVGGENEQSI